mmetsp:Transcript_11370/g.17958  ORF Transcript_11370/g.17958 Transcript_11370/m.17958 type:complete len:206 (+) Transcript_11370:416-1033(+)
MSLNLLGRGRRSPSAHAAQEGAGGPEVVCHRGEVRVLHAMLLADGPHRRRQVVVVRGAHAREQVVLDLVVQPTVEHQQAQAAHVRGGLGLDLVPAVLARGLVGGVPRALEVVAQDEEEPEVPAAEGCHEDEVAQSQGKRAGVVPAEAEEADDEGHLAQYGEVLLLVQPPVDRGPAAELHVQRALYVHHHPAERQEAEEHPHIHML